MSIIQPVSRSRGRPTLADVAKRAGVSIMTVSRVVNSQGSNVRSATRADVERAIRELNYVPNTTAKALALSRQTPAIAVLFDIPNATMFADMVGSVLEELSLSDNKLSFLRVRSQENFLGALDRLKASGILGVVLTPPLCDDVALRNALTCKGIRFVAIGCQDADPAFSATSIDDRSAAFDLTIRLLALGHRRIGFIAGPRNHLSSARRRAGFEAALAEFGLDADPALQWDGDYTFDGAIAIAEQILSRPSRPTAVFASNDDMAAAVINVARRWKIAVPESLSVCGFDDREIARIISPPLATVAQPLGAMAVWAVRQLGEELSVMAQGRDPEIRKLTLDYQLAFRGSIAPVAPSTAAIPVVPSQE